MMRTAALVLALFAFATTEAQRNIQVDVLMKAKAGYAHRLLDAVVLGELEVARDQAFRLRAVAETEDWSVVETPEYVEETRAFIQAAGKLVDSAAAKDVDGTALAYVEVTLSCVRCHRQMKASGRQAN